MTAFGFMAKYEGLADCVRIFCIYSSRLFYWGVRELESIVEEIEELQYLTIIVPKKKEVKGPSDTFYL